MATYDYRCEGCGHTFETKQSMNDAPLTECPECGENKLTKVIGSNPVMFKGYGWTPKNHRQR